MCKHVAAALYGVGARLDEKPELLFVLRNVGQKELLAGAGRDLAFARAKPGAKVIDDGDVAALFGLEMAEPAAETSVSVASARPKRTKPPAEKRVATPRKTKPIKKKAAKGRGVRGKVKLAPVAAKSRVPGNEVLGGVGKLESL